MASNISRHDENEVRLTEIEGGRIYTNCAKRSLYKREGEMRGERERDVFVLLFNVVSYRPPS